MTHPWFNGAPFLTASAFSTMAFLDRWARGEGGHWADWNERYFERKKKQGVAALRVFDETTFWHDRDDNPQNDHSFFNLDRATSLLMWNYNEIARSGPNDVRPRRLTAHHQICLLKLIRLARKHGMKIELVIDATLKHSPGVGWLVIGHCIRQVADFLKNLHRGIWVEPDHPQGGGMGSLTDPAVTERIQALFELVKGPINELVGVELHNEADAHSLQSWADSWPEVPVPQLRAKAFAEVNLQLDRMRREEYWPEGAVWVSQGGNDGHGSDLFEYDHTRADAIAVHPSRPNMEVGGRFNHLLNKGRPVYANEIIHYIDPSFWWTVEQGWFRPQSSTKDAGKRRSFIEGMLERGISVCDHGLVEMSNGMFRDPTSGDWYEMPLTENELLLTDGGGVEPPPPTRMRRYEPIIESAYLDILDRLPDDAGLESYNEQMARGLTEAEMREALIRSPEYEEKNPEL